MIIFAFDGLHQCRGHALFFIRIQGGEESSGKSVVALKSLQCQILATLAQQVGVVAVQVEIRKRKVANVAVVVCSVIMADLDAHKGAWPFRSPVDTKAFPMYRKVIKKPMDLASMQHKLNAHKYVFAFNFRFSFSWVVFMRKDW